MKYLFFLQNQSEEEQFFALDSDKTARVIWIHGDTVPLFEAMLFVYQKYKSYKNFKNILIHHEFDENLDLIRKLVVVQKVKSLYETVKSLLEVFPPEFDKELKEALKETLSEESVRKTCDAVILQDDDTLEPNAMKIKQKLSKEITESFDLLVCHKIIKCIDEKATKNIKNFKSSCKSTSTSTVKSMAISFSSSFEENITSALSDIETENYRNQIAHICADLFDKKRELICEEIVNQLREIFRITSSRLRGLLECINYLKNAFAWSDQGKCKYTYIQIQYFNLCD